MLHEDYNTVELFPHRCQFPTITPAESIAMAMQDLKKATLKKATKKSHLEWLLRLLIAYAALSFLLTIYFFGNDQDQTSIDFAQNLDKKKDRDKVWIFLNGSPHTGTNSFYNAFEMATQFETRHGPTFPRPSGCNSKVAEYWTKVYGDDLLSKYEKTQNQTWPIFASDQSCFVDFSRFEEQPFAIQMVQNPSSRWRSRFNDEISLGSKEKKLRSRIKVANLMGLRDPQSPNMTFENCAENDRCFSGHLLDIVMEERIAFTPCDACGNIFKGNTNSDPFTTIRGITPHRKQILATIQLTLTQYDALIPFEDMEGGRKMIEQMHPNIFSGIGGMEYDESASKQSSRKDVEGRGTSIIQSAAEQGGFLLTYRVACAKFCNEMERIKVQSDLCDSPRYRIDGDENAVINNGFLLWTTPLNGGLYNQLMIMTHLGELASDLNRTLIVPQMRYAFPKRRNFYDLVVEMENIYDIEHLNQSEFPSDLLQIHDVPPRLFLGNSMQYVDLDRTLKPPSRKIMKKEVKDMLKKHTGKKLLVVKRDETQNFSDRKISRLHGSFRLSRRLSLVLEDCMRFILDLSDQTPLSDEHWGSFAFLHARIERDMMMHHHIERYLSVSEIKKKVQDSTKEILHDIPPSKRTLFVSYGAGELVREDTPFKLKNGWPKEFRVVTSDDLEVILNRYTYLEKSAIVSEIATRSKVFIGHNHSSFSVTIGDTRRKKVYWYNDKERIGLTKVWK